MLNGASQRKSHQGSIADLTKKFGEIASAFASQQKTLVYRSNCTIFKSDFKLLDETGQIL